MLSLILGKYLKDILNKVEMIDEYIRIESEVSV